MLPLFRCSDFTDLQLSLIISDMSWQTMISGAILGESLPLSSPWDVLRTLKVQSMGSKMSVNLEGLLYRLSCSLYDFGVSSVPPSPKRQPPPASAISIAGSDGLNGLPTTSGIEDESDHDDDDDDGFCDGLPAFWPQCSCEDLQHVQFQVGVGHR